MSGVRNLRAMFENKASDNLSTSPPSRGRSPADSDTVNSRPVSKVRASFVAVERPDGYQGSQQWGLRKSSDISNMDTKELEGGLGLILKGSAFEPSTSAKPGGEADVQTEDALKPATNGVGAGKAASMVDKMGAAKDSGKAQPPTPTKLLTTKTGQPVKALPTRQIKPPAKPIEIKSPVLPKTPKTPNAPNTPGSATKTSPKLNKAISTTAAPSAPAARRPHENKAASEAEKKAESKAALPAKNDGKETKLNGERKIHARKSEPAQPRKVIAPAPPTIKVATAQPSTNGSTNPSKSSTETKSPTSTSISQRSARTNGTGGLAAHSTRSSLLKKPSRASLPVHNTAASTSDRPRSRVSIASRPADESFLARMMRPTASTASKAHEKVQVSSPPRGNKSTAGKSEGA